MTRAIEQISQRGMTGALLVGMAGLAATPMALGTPPIPGIGGWPVIQQQQDDAPRQEERDREEDVPQLTPQEQAAEEFRRAQQEEMQRRRERAAAEAIGRVAPAEPGAERIALRFDGPLDLSAFTDFVARTLEINIIEPGELQGRTVLFRAPLNIDRDQLMPLLQGLLNDNGFAIQRDNLGMYRIRAAANLPPGDLTSRVLRTPLVRPSVAQRAIDSQAGQTLGAIRYTPVDELGILLISGTPAALDAVERLLGQILEKIDEQRLIPFPLRYVAANFARDRVAALSGHIDARPGAGPAAIAAAGGQAGGGGQSVDGLRGLAERLIVEQDNTLIFKGTVEEAAVIADLINMVDRDTRLRVRRYVVGSVAGAAADAGRRIGLGDVTMLDATFDQFGGGGFARAGAAQQGAEQAIRPAGSGFIVDIDNGAIIYSGTEEQHARVEELVDQFRRSAAGDNIEIRVYKLLYAQASSSGGAARRQGGTGGTGTTGTGGFGTGQFGTTGASGGIGGSRGFGSGGSSAQKGVAEVLEELLQDPRERQFARSPFLPGQRGLGTQTRPSALPDESEIADVISEGGEGTRLVATAENTVIVADPDRNQIIIKAPARAQEQFAEIIAQLDQKQSQIMLRAQIVSVTTTDAFNWAADVQINAGQFSLLSSFGVTAEGASPLITDVRTIPGPGDAGGLKAGIIRSNFVPVAIQALATMGTTRVLSQPTALVLDNFEARFESFREEPFSSQSQTNTGVITSQGGVTEAGTTLFVTPRVSGAGDITLDIELELSDFVGQATGGLQPPVQRDKFSSSVTLPADSTIVIGGFRLNRESQNERKIPLLGDIPLIGNLFKAYEATNRQSVIFVFITPQVMRDRSGADLMLVTEGPFKEAGLDPLVPSLEPVAMPITGRIGPAWMASDTPGSSGEEGE